MLITVNNTTLQQNNVYKSSLFKNTLPNISTDNVTNTDSYTIIMVDNDAPYPSNNIYKYYMHLLVVDCNKTIFSYIPPSPPKDSDKHRYIINVYKQTNKIYDNATNFFKNMVRTGFDLNDFVKKMGLIQVDSFEFYCEP